MWKNKSVLWNLPASNFRLGELLEGSAGGKGNAKRRRRRGMEGEYRLRAGTSLMLSKEKIRSRKVICGRNSAQRARVAAKSSLSRFEI